MRIIIVLAAVAAFWAYGMVGTATMHDEIMAEQHCHEMVKSGAWPEEVCKKE